VIIANTYSVETGGASTARQHSHVQVIDNPLKPPPKIAYSEPTTYVCPSSSNHHPSHVPPSSTAANLLGDTDNTASGTGASVASLLALLVLALAEVVGAGVDDDGAAEHAFRADQLDELVRDGALGVALGVGLEVAQVADVALAVGGGTVGLVVGVDCG
jgi:hypothetical protein